MAGAWRSVASGHTPVLPRLMTYEYYDLPQRYDLRATSRGLIDSWSPRPYRLQQ